MRNFILKFLLVGAVVLSAIACGNTRKLAKDDNLYGAMYATETVMTKAQVDSMCFADELGMMETWFQMSYIDYETGTPITRYTYVRINSENSEIVYVIAPKGELYKITKRMVTE